MYGDTSNAGGTKSPKILVEDDGTVHVTGGIVGTQAAPSVVVDQGLSIVGSGNQTAGASAVIATAMTGAGYLTYTNTDPSLTMYVGGAVASTASYPLAPGASRTVRYADVTTVFAFGTGGTLGWIFER